MILPDFILPSYQNKIYVELGMDDYKFCIDKKHFISYPYNIRYKFNDRGYRDLDWPEDIDQLKRAIWCIGDSFTLGLGSPLEHTWPYLLQKETNRRIINVSLNGASNNWISRKTLDILNIICPDTVVIHWSYTHRREKPIEEIHKAKWKEFYNNVKDESWPKDPESIDELPANIQEEINSQHDTSNWRNQFFDEERREFVGGGPVDSSYFKDIEDTVNNVAAVETGNAHTNLIHSVIPRFSYEKHSEFANNEIKNCVKKFIPEFKQLDIARDGHHYDIKTSRYFVDQITKLF